MDVAVWGHNRGLPVKVYSSGGRFGLNDDGQTPNTQATTFTYADGSILTFEVRNLGSFEEADAGNCGNSFFGTKGFYVRDKGFFTYKDGKMSEREAIPVKEPEPDRGNKWDHFFQSRAFSQTGGYVCDDAGCAPVVRALPPWEHRVPAGPIAGVRPGERAIPRRRKQTISLPRISPWI